ncbi:acetyl-CoA carboxylase biotin carboxyl carrier protein subunit [Peptococcaceae bacterium]|nr:acetyl-CoA carboxylase biotin carboxyl carrier protein subunit [Peptococcaceae bacterium]
MATEVKAPVTGNLWKIEKKAGEMIDEYEVIMILESMKMEIPVEAPKAGKILEIKFAEGDNVMDGDVLAVIE